MCIFSYTGANDDCNYTWSVAKDGVKPKKEKKAKAPAKEKIDEKGNGVWAAMGL